MSGELIWDSTDDVILQALQRSGAKGLVKRDIFALFGRNRPAARINAALVRLQAAGKVVCQPTPSFGGRPRQVWHAGVDPSSLDALLDAITIILQSMPSEKERIDIIQRLTTRVLSPKK